MKTAVEWLVEKLSYSTSDGTIISHHKIITNLVEQAKEMEKNQIMDAHNQGSEAGYELAKNDDFIEGYKTKEANEYYNETFNSEKP